MSKSKSVPAPVAAPVPSQAPSPADAPWQPGKAYLVRTVTVFVVGRLISVHPNELVFADAAWVADTGRFHDALKTGKLNEVEPFVSPVIVGRGSICDATEWPHPLPLDQK